MKALRHRLGQGLRALLAFATRPDLDLAQQYLSACEFRAFCQLARAEQLHSLTVLRRALAADPAAPPALTAAALLHDVGKARYRLAVWQKTAAVLIQAGAPALSRRLSQGERLTVWRAPFIVGARHAKWSGETLRACGSDAAVVWLVERHQEEAAAFRGHALYELLLRLQEADNGN